MNKLTLPLVAIGVMSLSAVASAQSTSFEGAYGQLGIGYESVTPSFSSSGIAIAGVGTVPISTSVSNGNSFAGVVTVGYMGAITKDFLLGIGAEYEPLNSSSANYSYSAAGTTVSGTWKKQNSYNIFLSPATPVGANGLLYGKVGYTGAQVQATEGGTSSSTNLNGYMLGIGYKQIITGGLYGFGEVNYASYSNSSNTYSGVVLGRAYSYTNTVSANSTNVVVGLGYKF
jgi:opacity protein-like surface antigen